MSSLRIIFLWISDCGCHCRIEFSTSFLRSSWEIIPTTEPPVRIIICFELEGPRNNKILFLGVPTVGVYYSGGLFLGVYRLQTSGFSCHTVGNFSQMMSFKCKWLRSFAMRAWDGCLSEIALIVPTISRPVSCEISCTNSTNASPSSTISQGVQEMHFNHWIPLLRRYVT